ncbi:MAG: hypothetical protein NTY36_18220 [Deltaproteobacteria bacterium]|nr:hypothetical protein [Deltaproteobacteria bacterium]
MRIKIPDQPTRLKLISIIILLVGLGCAAWIYQRAENVPYGALGYVNEGGILYPVMPDDSKQYLRSMELYGGKANVLADQFRRWFVGLWQGKSLAFIIACATIITSGGFFYAANHLNPLLEANDDHENHGDEKN